MSKIPDDYKPILAQLFCEDPIDASYWYEVIYFEDNVWKHYGNEKYFTRGEEIVEWEYCSKLL